jgi:hypothetical protein
MSISAAKYVSSIQTLTVPASVENIVGQTTHLLQTDGDTMGAVACLCLENGPPIYLWPSGKTYYRGAATAEQRTAVANWIAALLK